jgi:hypothetical protein
MSVCTLLPSTRWNPKAESLRVGSSERGDGQVLPYSISAFWVSGAPLFDQRSQAFNDAAELHEGGTGLDQISEESAQPGIFLSEP